jgi:hypothetical protein
MRFPWLFTPQRPVGTLVLALVLGVGGTGWAQEMATLTDISGTVIKLQTFEVHLRDSEEYRNLGGSSEVTAYFRGRSLESSPSALPIRQSNGAIFFVALDSIKEFQSDGKRATVILVNGDQVQGSPLSGASIEGPSAVGKVSVPLPKVRNLRFNPESAREYMRNQEEEFDKRYSSLGEFAWPAKYKSKAEVTLVSGDQFALGALAFITEFTSSGCDSTWIPCRPWSYPNQQRMQKSVPIRLGESDGELEFSKARSLVLTAPSKPEASPISLNITLRSGEQVTATIRTSEKPVGFVGTTPYGFAHIPIGRVKSVTFTD